MRKRATAIAIGVLSALLAAPLLQAQPVRNGVDVIWARDVEGAAMVLDGMLDEPAWLQAEVVPLVYDQEFYLPGGGQKIEGNPVLVEPLDGNDGTLHVLRDGNVLWLGLDVWDTSIGGGRALVVGNWFFDGFIMALTDRTARDRINYEGANQFMRPIENIMGWFHPADTLDGGLPVPGIAPRYFGDYGVGFGDSLNAARTPEKEAVLQWAHSIKGDGIANDDTHGDDVGYQFEVKLDLGLLGYDFSEEGGDSVPFSFALQDADYNWPYDEDQFFVSRVWWQNQWANNFNEGVAYIHGAPGVTVGSGLVPEVTAPEFHVYNAGTLGAPTLDGQLDDPVWAGTMPIFQLQYKAGPEIFDANAGTLAPYFMRWFRPDINGDGNAAVVVDPSVGRVHMTFAENILYLGVDVDDQAISGIAGEAGGDGFRLLIRQQDSLATSGSLNTINFDFFVDSTGAISYGRDAATFRLENPESVIAAAFLKGASTVADPSDVDEGYHIEAAIDMVATGIVLPDMSDMRIWVAGNLFDGDYLESQADSYATRTWIVGERGPGASIYGYLDASAGVATERDGALPERISLEGNYPNPFNPSTTLRYALGESGKVRLLVFDVVGRRVAEVDAGVQPEGRHELRFDGSGLVSGVYVYRLDVTGRNSGNVATSTYGRMILLK